MFQYICKVLKYELNSKHLLSSKRIVKLLDISKFPKYLKGSKNGNTSRHLEGSQYHCGYKTFVKF
jgi:hypothetical protein